ncbi:hypothetical protein Pisl_0298 [Pyrobaculum islandicum DSM 4184]|uniref:Uncharacterized protein n=1 Tax=Pyrobaculum islandicum (strain DSM 4184 / JCM 9189 / GEO3) TaxID=384616 RepID=A1RR94_PYRIL|nr:hypothetical protein Pisl_0298 [Pyrobaculum islandicum DSM 4184]
MVRHSVSRGEVISTKYPRCSAKMEKRDRQMQCPACGFKAHRDNALMTWAERRYQELIEKTKQPVFLLRRLSYF